jgi:hypothetical protein
LLPNFSRWAFCFLPPVNLDLSPFFLLLSLFVFILFLLGLFGLLIPSFLYIGCCSSGLHHSRIFRLLPVSGRELQTRTRCDDRCRRMTFARSQGPKKIVGCHKKEQEMEINPKKLTIEPVYPLLNFTLPGFFTVCVFVYKTRQFRSPPTFPPPFDKLGVLPSFRLVRWPLCDSTPLSTAGSVVAEAVCKPGPMQF